jgi:hypothetical protein
VHPDIVQNQLRPERFRETFKSNLRTSCVQVNFQLPRNACFPGEYEEYPTIDM